MVAGYAVAVPVGAIAALLISLTARTSLRIGSAAALGVATADGLYCALAVVGGAAVARLVEPVSGPLRWAAMVVLLALAARTAYTAWRARTDAPTVKAVRGLTSPGRAFLGLLALTVLNPSTVVYFTALVLGRQGDSDAVTAVVFVAAAFLASASWQLLLAAGGGLLGRVLTGPRGRFATATVSSVVIAVLAVGLVLG
ncbi:LysE family transporter [Virgisporangium ochraceum]|nr:LysE family transporter [Virgisporangium ochraceum]